MTPIKKPTLLAGTAFTHAVTPVFVPYAIQNVRKPVVSSGAVQGADEPKDDAAYENQQGEARGHLSDRTMGTLLALQERHNG